MTTGTAGSRSASLALRELLSAFVLIAAIGVVLSLELVF